MDQNAKNDDIICDVCLEEDDYEGDEIIICDLCLTGVHQSCYGGKIKDKLPGQNEKWYCDRCEYLLRNQSTMSCLDIKCVLCPDVDGMMKQVGNNMWAHIVCVNWNPEIWFIDEFKNQIAGQVSQFKQELKCLKCVNKGSKASYGAKIQCDFKCCTKSYHVRCAIKLGLIRTWDEMDERSGSPPDSQWSFLPVFCLQHVREGLKIFKKSG